MQVKYVVHATIWRGEDVTSIEDNNRSLSIKVGAEPVYKTKF